MGLQQVPEMDYRSRFKDFLALEEKRNGLVEVHAPHQPQRFEPLTFLSRRSYRSLIL